MCERPSPPASGFGWRLDVEDSPLLSMLAYALPAVFGGVAVLFGVAVLATVRAGEYGVAVGSVAVAAVVLLARRWFLPAVAGTDLLEPLFRRYSRGGVVFASAVGAATVYASFRLHPLAPFAVFVASWVPFALVAGFPTEGRWDPSEGTLVVDGDPVPLASVESIRALSLGAFVLCWVSYSRGVPSAPRALVVPRERFDRVRSLLVGAENGEAPPSADADDTATVSAAQRWTLVAFGVGFVAVGPALWVALPGEGSLVALYAGALFGLFGAVFLWYAVTA